MELNIGMIAFLYCQQVRTEMGPQSLMLSENEVLWEKDLPGQTEVLLR